MYLKEYDFFFQIDNMIMNLNICTLGDPAMSISKREVYAGN